MSSLPAWFDPEFPTPEKCVIQQLLDGAFRDNPDRRFASFEDGSELSYRDLYHRTRQRAAALQQLGVNKGDRVLVWLPNNVEIILSWFAINYIGGCYVPINTSYRGQLLQHVIANSGARIIIAHTQLIERLGEVDPGQLAHIVAIGEPGQAAVAEIKVESQAVLEADEAELQAVDSIMPWDLQCIIYTSGTTGPSKGVLSSYCHHYTIASVAHGHMTEDDCMMVNMPLFHVSGTGAVMAALISQGSIAVFDGFSTSLFWDQVCEHNVTVVCGLVGSMAQFLEKNEPRANDADNPLRMALLFPVSETTIELSKRYRFDYISGFGMTELPVALVTDINCRKKGTCGKPRSGIECRLVDEYDCEVKRGEIGELIVRSDTPWSLVHGYNEMPKETAQSWRNGWFHTGDLFRQDEEGDYFYVDRRKDSIRRRGENISSQEVENAVFTYPDVRDVAAVAVPSEHEEDEVLVVVSTKPDRSVDPENLFEFLRSKLAHFMLPRYIRVLDELPQTPTNKVKKHLLREQGVTADTWDREAAGIVVKREKLR